MRWDDFRRSSNIEDERADSGGGGFPGGAGGLGLGTIVILGLIGWALGIDPSVLINGAQILSGSGGTGTQQSGAPAQMSPQDQETADFVAAVLGDTEDRWTEIFQASGRTYHAPKLVLFSGAIQGGCGL
ncbi:MAG: neutral zinc metallopeptidase, partial [Xanthobacteraceae bacterium]